MSDSYDDSELKRALDRLRPTPEQEARQDLWEALIFAENKAKLEQVVTDLVFDLTGVTPDNDLAEASTTRLLDRLEDEHLSGPGAFEWWKRPWNGRRDLPDPEK